MEGGRNSDNNSNNTSSMENKTKVSKLATATSTTTGNNTPPPSTPANATTLPKHHEQKYYMPIGNVTSLMLRGLPSGAIITNEAKETMQKCIYEFISFVRDEANDICKVDRRKKITAEDLIEAMSRLGFDHYAKLLSTFIHRYREAEGNDYAQAQWMILNRPNHVGPNHVGPNSHKRAVVVGGIGGGNGESNDHGTGSTINSTMLNDSEIGSSSNNYKDDDGMIRV